MERFVNVALILLVIAMTVGSGSNTRQHSNGMVDPYQDSQGSELSNLMGSPTNSIPYGAASQMYNQPAYGSNYYGGKGYGGKGYDTTGDQTNGNSGTYQRGFPWTRDIFPKLESPIDIIKSHAQSINFPPLYVVYNPSHQLQTEVANSGHGIQITIKNEYDKPYLAGGPLLSEYVFSNLHLHWGKTATFGSEHFIDGESYAMEGHLVTYKRNSGSIEAALSDPEKDGVVVLTFFGQISETDNMKLKQLLDTVPRILEGEAKASVSDPDILLWFLSSLDINKGYYVYPGSLTTPPFTDSVQFIIMPNPIPISNNQLETLRTMRDRRGQRITSNRRELQPLFQRPVYYVNNQIKKISENEVDAYYKR